MMQEYGLTAKLLSDFDTLNQVTLYFCILFIIVAHLLPLGQYEEN